jgi:hypothetical protein
MCPQQVTVTIAAEYLLRMHSVLLRLLRWQLHGQTASCSTSPMYTCNQEVCAMMRQSS